MKNDEIKNAEKAANEPDFSFGEEDIELEITKLESRINSTKQKKKAIYLFFLLFIITGVTTLLFGPFIVNKLGYGEDISVKVIGLYGIAAISYGLIFIFIFPLIATSKISSLQRDLDLLRTKKRIMSRTTIMKAKKINYHILIGLSK